jgi:diguanylate cyclase (GGDEF)-like protein
MKRLIPAVAFLLGFASAVWAAAPSPLTTIRAIRALSSEEASHALPVAIEATVTYFGSARQRLFVQEDGAGIYVMAPKDTKLLSGDRVLIKGTTQSGFRTNVMSNDITLLHHGVLPKPVPATFDALIRSQFDSTLVTVRAVVRAADPLPTSAVTPVRTIALRMLTDEGSVDALVDSDDANALKDLLDAEVEVTGVAGGVFDGKMQQTGVMLYVAKLAGIRILKHAGASPWSLPVTPMDQILSTYNVQNLTQRIRVRGTITYYEPGSTLVLQSGARSLLIKTQTYAPLRIGDLVDATGFPSVNDGFLVLTGSEIQDVGIPSPIAPQPVAWRQLTSSKHLFDLVSIEGVVVTAFRGTSQDEYALVSDGYMFSAIYRHATVDGAVSLSPMKQIPVGSRVRVAGICILEYANPFDRNVPFNILMRSPDDIAVVARPSWLNTQNLIRVVSVLLVVVIASVFWGATLKRKVRRQTAALSARIDAEAAMEREMTQLEQRRSRILEDINGSRPLAEILEEIAELVSFRLEGAPCWCEVADGARLGSYPAAPESLRIARADIPARVGPPLGVLFAGFYPGSLPGAHEAEALSVGARLATLAIETRRLYSDLVHRSEFDLLTDIHNRFSLEKHMDALIDEARQKAGIFGLIYIDLDEFKQVNDLYGHRIGDLYLQEVATRMKQQLRTHDILARLGGDEFAVLVAVVRNRAAAEEIALRLECCFHDPFLIEGNVLHGSASVGLALYPEDGLTKDSLLNVADAAMYAAKYSKRQVESAPDEFHSPRLTPNDRA